MSEVRLIDAEALKKAITENRNIDRNAVCDVLDIIDNAPTPFNPTVVNCNTNALSNEETEKLIKTFQSARIVPDNLQGWRYEETPQEIPTFNRKELEKARDYWYSHLEAHNEEQNEAAWAAINAIKYCIEHDSGYQKGAEND